MLYTTNIYIHYTHLIYYYIYYCYYYNYIYNLNILNAIDLEMYYTKLI